MVEDRVTDGKRIAQLLASELTGLETGPLADVAVIDAEPDVDPSPDGVAAYGIAYRERRVGTVEVYPDRAVVSLVAPPEPVDPATLAVPAEVTDDGISLTVGSGVAVKRAVDGIRTVLSRRNSGE